MMASTSSNEQNDLPPSNRPLKLHHNRKKSNSISNAVLANQRNHIKKVSFNHGSTSNLIMASPSPNYASSNSSSNSSSTLSPSDSSNEDDRGEEKIEKRRHSNLTSQLSKLDENQETKSTNHSLKKKPSGSHLRSNPQSRLTRFTSYPNEKMNISKSLDSHLSNNFNTNTPNNDSNTILPEFNKRPLTDTPIVSSMGSPITKYQSSDYYDTDDDMDDNKKTIDEKLNSNSKRPILKTKNISHLNLTDLDDKLNSSSVSPMTSTTNVSKKEEKSNKLSKTKSSEHRLNLDEDVRADLLHDVPIELQQEFEKTPSLEQLKNLLLTKPPPPAHKAYTLNIPGQTSSKTSPDGHIASVDVGSKLVIVMVGLPARGKSYITNKLTRYLNWLQHDCRVFNVGNTRRKDKNNSGPEANPLPDINTPQNESQNNTNNNSPALNTKDEEVVVKKDSNSHNADFFNPNNKNSNTLREKWAMDTLDQLLNYVIDGSGSVGIFDATNSTKSRRLKVLKRIQQRSKGELKVLYLESICSDPSIIESNIRLKLSGPDYKSMDPEVALKDFVGRLRNYEKAYETIDELEESIPGFQYVKMIDVGKKVVSYNIQGFLASQTIYFLLNFNLCERQIWITRHGESVDNLSGRIGGDSHLTKRGQKFSKTLANFMDYQRSEFRKQQLERFSTRLELKYNSIFGDDSNESSNDDDQKLDNIPTEPNFCVWTSMLFRAVETGKYFDEQLFSIKEMRMLNELGGGKFEGLTYNEIQKKYPKEFDSRLRNKLTYRYPGVGGESYLDVLTRLRPLITEIERTTDHLLIISHRVVLRILLAYFLNLDKSSIGELDVPLHTLYCLELKPYGTDYRMYEYDESLDWFVKREPEHQKNMKEVGVLFKERKYSVVPTAPPSSKRNRPKTVAAPNAVAKDKQNDAAVGNFSLRRSLSFGARLASSPSTTDDQESANNSLSKKLEDLKNLRTP
ncbi:6PF2K-domain-containing protein [Hyphopichia burtonii NRRL Y-1933]|uniref:6PF2K-domain-containing protein n=1 Tax=Hyphopichia burtonii NRRL Y-1933 TaxID=984485 RepID=A0A1E4RD51_9ASCO|nr:6PF2K-domain-containing protein [Hyphopichia burtonii NRRL Y-1933]ODV65156.1 6PF2K-domain-containing protein [Hyphopichia burtonii NRRL Y-1933]